MTLPKKYRKIPVVVDAIQFNGYNYNDIYYFMGYRINYLDMVTSVLHETIDIHTRHGTLTADIGDYVIRDADGEYYICKQDIFDKKYTIEEEK